MKRSEQILVIACVIAAVLFMVAAAHCQSNPLPLGTVTNNGSVGCSGFPKNAVCSQLLISCPNVAEATVTIGVVSGGAPIFLMNGSGWTLVGQANYASRYIKDGYTVIQAKWAVPWQAPGVVYTGNLMNAACRPATLLNYVANGLPVAVQAGSGGAGALGYALSWYGLASLVSVAEITSGPVYSNIEQGCEVPQAAAVEILPTDGSPWSDQPYYSPGVPQTMTQYTGYVCLPKNATSGTADQAWLNESINALGAETSFSTYLSLWLCASSQSVNNSEGQGYLWISQITSPWQLTAMTGCSGSEDIDGALTPEGETGFNALVGDLEGRW